jgi:regulatory protein
LLERYCIYQDRCHKEVAQKLYTIGMFPDARDVILLHLLQHDFLNEERFAKSYVRGKFNSKKWGRIKIVNALKFKQISAYNIKTGLLEIEDQDYLDTLKKLAVKKTPLIKAKNKFERKKKLITYLLGKGYEFSLILDVLGARE